MANILVFGTGSIGSVYATILWRAGVAVTCVCRSNYDAVKSHGLRVTSTLFGDLQAHPTVAANVPDAVSLAIKPFDFVLVATKATSPSTTIALESIKPAITPGVTTIVLIQNGLGVEPPFREAFPETPLISGVAYLPTTQTAPGVFSHSEVELLYIGLYQSSSDTPASSGPLKAFAQLLREAGATAIVSEDIQAQRWTKILANAAVNPICALSRCRDRQLITLSGPAATLLREVMLEVAAVGTAAGYGHVTTLEAVEKQFARSMNRPHPGVEPSMMADALAGRPLEVQAILGSIVQAAHDKEVETPRLTLLLVLLEGLDFALQAERDKSVAKS